MVNYLPFGIGNRLKLRPNFAAILENIGWLFIDKIIRMGIGLFVAIWVARYLGVDQYGTLNYVIAFAGLFGAVASLGLDGIVVRNIVQRTAEEEKMLASAFILKFEGGIVAFLLSLVAAKIVRPNDEYSAYLVGIVAAGMIFQSFDVVDLWFQSQVKSKYTVLAKNGAFLIAAFMKVFFILKGASLVAFAWAILVESMIGAMILLVLFARRKSITTLLYGSSNIMKQLLQESWPLALSSIAIFIYMRIDQVMLAQMISDKEVGFYAAALRFSEIWYFIPAAIMTSVAPPLTQIRITSMEKYTKRLQQVFNWLVRIAFLIALPMTFIAYYLLVFLYGEEFQMAGPILAIHIWTALFVFLGVGSSLWTINEGTMRYSFLQTVIGAFLNICLNYFVFIPLYGAVGAAIATLLSQFVAAFAINAFIPRLRPLFVIQMKALLNPVCRT